MVDGRCVDRRVGARASAPVPLAMMVGIAPQAGEGGSNGRHGAWTESPDDRQRRPPARRAGPGGHFVCRGPRAVRGAPGIGLSPLLPAPGKELRRGPRRLPAPSRSIRSVPRSGASSPTRASRSRRSVPRTSGAGPRLALAPVPMPLVAVLVLVIVSPPRCSRCASMPPGSSGRGGRGSGTCSSRAGWTSARRSFAATLIASCDGGRRAAVGRSRASSRSTWWRTSLMRQVRALARSGRVRPARTVRKGAGAA